MNKDEKLGWKKLTGKAMQEKFYKLARPDGWDFFTGKTIDYRENIGQTVRRKHLGKVKLCSNTCLHASRDPNHAFIGAKIPCSVFEVTGKPYAEDDSKCGFKQLKIIRELKPEKVFKWRYKEVVNPINPLKIKPPKITKKHINLVKQWASVRDSVRDSVRASVRDSVWASVRDSVWDSVWDSVGGSVWASVRTSVRASVWDSVWDLVGDSVWDSVWDSVGGSVGVYIGYIFTPVVQNWKHIKHEPGEYPFQPAVDLWKQGLVPSFDSKKWRLHGGKDARVLWEE